VRLNRWILGLVTVVVCQSSAQAQNRCEVFPPGGYVGVFADSLGADSVIALAPDRGAWVGSFHILAVLSGAVANGIAGAEFRVHLPLAPMSSLFVATTINPHGNPVLGQPISVGSGSAGLFIGFAPCERGYAGANGKVIVPIARVSVVSLAAFDTPVYVKMMSVPDFRAPCPNFRRCDTMFSPAPMVMHGTDESGDAIAFHGRLFCSDGQVGTAHAGWDRVKALYR
jgi:hypothetical protein